MSMPLIILSLDFFFFCAYFILHPHVERSKMSSQSAICVFICYGEGKKGYRYFDTITQKLYVSCHVVFLEHISFFSIPSTTHGLIRFDIIRIDHFSKNFDSLSYQVPSTSNIPPHVRPIHINHSAGTDTLLSSTQEAPFSYMVPPASFEIVDLPLHQSIRIRKSTKLPDFALLFFIIYFFFSFYSLSFLALFL